jgi:hypothetical protein
MVVSERSRPVINDSCQGRGPRDYTGLGNEPKTAAKRLAMARNVSMRGLGVLLLAASGLINCLPIALHAQEQGAPVGVRPSPSRNQEKAPARKAHRFWDRENDWLFAGVGASRTFDYFSTLNMRRRGRQEIFLTNDAVDNHAAFAAIEASATGVSIGAAYLFHRYGHHKLERWTSIVHLGLATTGSVRNYCLKTAHFAATPGSP